MTDTDWHFMTLVMFKNGVQVMKLQIKHEHNPKVMISDEYHTCDSAYVAFTLIHAS